VITAPSYHELKHPSLGQPVAFYPYHRASGDVAFGVARFDPKDFRPATPTGNGKWRWSLDGAPKLLYQLPRIDEALAKSETIWIVDGEKDADALLDRGVAATCVARAQGWSLELADQLIGARRIRIVADNDSGAGMRQALEVRDLLLQVTGIGSHEIEIVHSAAGKDTYDHFEAGYGLEEFELMLDPLVDEPKDTAWRPVSAIEFLQLPEPAAGHELLGPLVLRGGRTLVGGDSGHGKTTLAYAMVAAIVGGTELLGWTGIGLGPALIIDLEQGVRSIKRGIREAELGPETFVLNLPDGLALDQNPGELKLLEDSISALRPSVISLDPYYKAHRGDANEERAVTDLMRNLDRLRSEYMFALLLPAHVRKDIQGGGVRKLTLADIAGSGAISRGAEIVLGIERLSHGQARLRYLKDREGDLPVGDAIDLLYSHEEGFTVKEGPSSESIEGSILAVEDSGWLTAKEWRVLIGFGMNETKRVLERLAAARQIAFMVGPEGRSSSARCFSTTPQERLYSDEEFTSVHPSSPGLQTRGELVYPTPPKGGGTQYTPEQPTELNSDTDDIELD
jgi:hypothetical protein